MNVILVQPPPRADLVEIVKDSDGRLRGRITRPWQNYLDDFFTRVGGNVAPSNDDLGELVDSIQMGVFTPHRDPYSDNSLSAQYVLSTSSFIHQPVALAQDDASSMILAGQVFGA